MSFPRYPKYKDSGVEWLGEVPEGWEVKPVRNVASIVNGYPFDSKLFDQSYGFPLIRIRDINKAETEAFYQGDFVESAAITEADVLIGMDGDFNVGRWLGKGKGLLNQRMCCVRGNSNPLTFLLEYALPIPLKAINEVTYATTVKHLSSNQIAKTFIAVPSIESELQGIINFLDRETDKIDALVAEQENLIALLKEKRQAVISHAVTKGLDPTVPMKDSGIEWLGEVPAHWELVAVKRMCDKITDGAHVSPDTEGGVYDFVSIKDVLETGIDFDGCLKTSPESYDYLVRTGCRPLPGDVLFSKDGTVGRTVIVKGDREFVVASSLIIIRPSREALDANYLSWLCQSFIVLQQVEGFVKGAGLPRLSIKSLLKVFGVFPPASEQADISNFLVRETAKLDTLTAEAQRGIDLLKERRSALISAAVTGKIDVRGYHYSQPQPIV